MRGRIGMGCTGMGVRGAGSNGGRHPAEYAAGYIISHGIIVVKCLEAEFARTFHVDLNSFLAFGDYFYKPASFFYPFWIIYFG